MKSTAVCPECGHERPITPTDFRTLHRADCPRWRSEPPERP